MVYFPVINEKVEGTNGFAKTAHWYNNGRKIVIVCKSVKSNFSRLYKGR